MNLDIPLIKADRGFLAKSLFRQQWGASPSQWWWKEPGPNQTDHSKLSAWSLSGCYSKLDDPAHQPGTGGHSLTPIGREGFELRPSCPGSWVFSESVHHPARGQIQFAKGRWDDIGVPRRWGSEDMGRRGNNAHPWGFSFHLGICFLNHQNWFAVSHDARPPFLHIPLPICLTICKSMIHCTKIKLLHIHHLEPLGVA